LSDFVATFKAQHQQKKKYANKVRVHSTKHEYEGKEVPQLLCGRKPKREGVPLPRVFSKDKLLDTTIVPNIFGSNSKRHKGQVETSRLAAEATRGGATLMNDSDSGEDGEENEEGVDLFNEREEVETQELYYDSD
jgi:hypothetical protein